MPPICHKNGLEVVKEPKLTRLNKFDNMLIARKIPFMFISQLPVSRMEALKGKSTLVPSTGETKVAGGGVECAEEGWQSLLPGRI